MSTGETPSVVWSFHIPFYLVDRFLTVYTFFRPDAKLGLSVKAVHNIIALTKISEDGLGAGAFEIGDILLDVDGVAVTSVEDIKTKMLAGLKSRGYVSTVIR